MVSFSFKKNVICKFVSSNYQIQMENSIKALELKEKLDRLRPIDKVQEEQIMQKFRLDWNYHSNHLEGNSLTYGETKALILFGITAQGKPLQDHFEITGHNEAINWVIDVVKGDYPLNENFIRELHTLLLKQSYEVDAITPDGKPTKKRIQVGSYKTSPNHVKTKTGEMFYFATPEETPSKMTDLINWYREKCEQEEVNPIFLAAEFHYKFIRIHPFDDGNGRTARILMNFILMKFNFPPVIIKTEDKANYFSVLRLADAGNIKAFIEYIAQNLVHSLQIMIAGANGENIEEEDDLDKEIALLEKHLSGFGEKVNSKKNNDDIHNLISNDIEEIRNRINSRNSVFSKMYLENETNTFLTIGSYNHEKQKTHSYTIDFQDLFDLTLSYEENINKSIDAFIIEFRFNTFNRELFNGFNYYSEIKFIFNDFEWKVFINKENILNKRYGINLSEEEINLIVKTELKNHKEFIEQKISEQENR